MGRIRPNCMGWAKPGPFTWAGPNLAQMHGLVTVHTVTRELISQVTVHMHSNRVINSWLAERAQCTFCMQEDEQ